MNHIATLTLASLFVVAPMTVVPLLDKNARLDLIDLYEAGLKAQIGNRYGGATEMTMLSDTLIELKLTSVSTMQLRLTPDSIIEMRHSVEAPDLKSTKVRRFDVNWNEKP